MNERKSLANSGEIENFPPVPALTAVSLINISFLPFDLISV